MPTQRHKNEKYAATFAEFAFFSLSFASSLSTVSFASLVIINNSVIHVIVVATMSSINK